MDKVRIGFVGVGGMGQCAHLRNYVTVPDCEVVAIAEVREELGRKVAAHYGVPKVYRSHEELLANEKLDGIVASQPFNRHGMLGPDLLKAGVPVFIEKPLAVSLEVGEKLAAAEAASGTFVMVGYHKRSDPASMWAKAEIDKLVASQELGKMRYVRLTMPMGDWVTNGFLTLIKTDEPIPPLEKDPPPADMDEESHNIFFRFINGWIHQMNLLAYFLGERYNVKYADKNGVMLAAETDSGRTAVIEIDPYRTSVEWQESAFISFENGWIKVELPAPLALNRPGSVEIYRDPGNGVTPELSSPRLPWIHAMRQQAMNFVSAIKGEIKPLCTAAEAMEDLKASRDYMRLYKGV